MTVEEQIYQLVSNANPVNPMEYVASIVRPLMRNRIDEYLQTDEDIQSEYSIRSITKGDSQASVLLIGEHIIESQLSLGKETVYPFEGTEEKELLDKIIEAYHINPNQLFYMNIINQYPSINVNGKILYRPPTSEELAIGKDYVNIMIECLQPVLIILMGNIALNAFKKGIIQQERGNWFEIKGIQTMPTYSPSFLLEMEKKHQDIVEEYQIEFAEDMRKAFCYVQDNFKGNVLLEHLEA